MDDIKLKQRLKEIAKVIAGGILLYYGLYKFSDHRLFNISKKNFSDHTLFNISKKKFKEQLEKRNIKYDNKLDTYFNHTAEYIKDVVMNDDVLHDMCDDELQLNMFINCYLNGVKYQEFGFMYLAICLNEAEIDNTLNLESILVKKTIENLNEKFNEIKILFKAIADGDGIYPEGFLEDDGFFDKKTGIINILRNEDIIEQFSSVLNTPATDGKKDKPDDKDDLLFKDGIDYSKNIDDGELIRIYKKIFSENGIGNFDEKDFFEKLKISRKKGKPDFIALLVYAQVNGFYQGSDESRNIFSEVRKRFSNYAVTVRDLRGTKEVVKKIAEEYFVETTGGYYFTCFYYFVIIVIIILIIFIFITIYKQKSE